MSEVYLTVFSSVSLPLVFYDFGTRSAAPPNPAACVDMRGDAKTGRASAGKPLGLERKSGGHRRVNRPKVSICLYIYTCVYMRERERDKTKMKTARK